MITSKQAKELVEKVAEQLEKDFPDNRNHASYVYTFKVMGQDVKVSIKSEEKNSEPSIQLVERHAVKFGEAILPYRAVE